MQGMYTYHLYFDITSNFHIQRSADVKFNNVLAITSLRNLRNNYQRNYERQLKGQNWVKLREQDRFLHYEEIQQVVKELMNEFLEGEKDPLKVSMITKCSLTKKAVQLQKFLVLLFYTSLPPSRALEIRSLQYGSSLQFRKTTNSWWLVFDKYKTVRQKGVDSLELDPKSQNLLIVYLELFINDYRELLMKKWWKHRVQKTPSVAPVDDKYLFVCSPNSRVQNFSDTAWSNMICTLFKERTGISISVNNLRSSFITYFYDSEDSANLNLRESIATGMRHSIAEAKRTYDRRCI